MIVPTSEKYNWNICLITNFRTTYFKPWATSASLALFPATTTRLSVSRASILPPCHPIAFISKGTTWKKKKNRRGKICSLSD